MENSKDMRAARETYLVQPVRMEAKTAGGIFLTDQSRQEPMRYGIVLDRGEGTPANPKVGDVVYFSAGTETVLDFDAAGRPADEFIACPMECVLAWKRPTKEQLDGLLMPSAIAEDQKEKSRREGRVLAR